MDKLPISVIIITRNAEKTIDECLSSVQRNNPAEIIVVDGSSTDRTLDIARRYTERIYSDKGGGKSHARQLGAEQATQEYIAYFDSDVTLTDGALATMLSELQNSDYINIKSRGMPLPKRLTYWEWAQWEHARLCNPVSHLEEYIGMAGCLFRREILLKYGFELAYGGHMDDVPLENRLIKDGYKFGTSSAIHYHNHYKVAHMKGFARYRFFLGRVKVCYIRKYGPWQAGYWAPLVASYWLAFCVIKGRPKLIPLHIVDGIAQTAGMLKGFVELIGEKIKKSKSSNNKSISKKVA